MCACFRFCKLGVFRAGLNSIRFVLYDHENWLVCDFRDETVYVYLRDYSVFFIYFIASVIHYYFWFGWSIFILFEQRSVISHDHKTMHFYFPLLLLAIIKFFVKFEFCASQHPLGNKNGIKHLISKLYQTDKNLQL